eukprot:1749095-Ditylum_brightwellii.AAC.1
MACFVYHTKSCPRGRLILFLTYGERSLSSTTLQLALISSSFVFGVIGRRNCLPSRKSSLGLLFKKEVQWTCFVA